MQNYNDRDRLDRQGLSLDEACHVAGIGKTSMLDLVKAGAVPARRCGRRVLILRSDLITWLDALPRLEPGVA